MHMRRLSTALTFVLASVVAVAGCTDDVLTPTAPSPPGASTSTTSEESSSGYELLRLGGEDSQAIELNDVGIVAGVHVRDAYRRAAYWTVDQNGTITGPFELGIAGENVESFAVDVNDAGHVIALVQSSPSPGFIYDVATETLTELSSPEGALGATPRSINAGDVVTGNALYEVDGETAYLPVAWTDPFDTRVEPTPLPLPEGHVSSCSLPVPLNDAGAMVARLMDEDGACWLVRWQLESDGSVSGPQVLESSEASFFRWMNEAEQMAGLTGAGTGSSQAVVREPDGSLVQLDPVSGDDQAVAIGITDPASDGSLQVTGTSGTRSVEEKAVVWSVASDGTPSGPVVLPVGECEATSRAQGINADGWIAGKVEPPGSTTGSVAVLWRPVSEGGAGDGCSGTSHIGDLDGSSSSQGGTWTASVDALVLDGSGDPVADATVSGSWSGGASGSGSCVSAADGRCTVSVDGISKRNKSVTFTVEDVFHADLAYDATANSDPDGDSDGTSITVSEGDTDDGGGDDGGDCVPKGPHGNNCK